MDREDLEPAVESVLLGAALRGFVMIDDDDAITVPMHYRTLAAALKPLIREVERAFINRPPPTGLPWSDLDQAITRFGAAVDDFDTVLTALKEINERILTEADASDETVRTIVARLEEPVGRFLNEYRLLWEQPFPIGLEEGQYLAAAVFERLLRQLLDVLEHVVALIEDPEGAMVRHGSTAINLNAHFQAHDEVSQFDAWRKGIISSPAASGRKGFSAGALLAGFLLGSWWDGHNK